MGCGSGDLLRAVRDEWQPDALVGTDVLPWLAPDLADDVRFIEGDAEAVLATMVPVDRLLMVEVIEHLEAPWRTLRSAAAKVAPGGRLVLTTPNLRTLRHRLELGVRGELTCFRADNPAHLTPVLEHVPTRILTEEGFRCETFYAGADYVPHTGVKLWPSWALRLFPRLTNMSMIIVAVRP